MALILPGDPLFDMTLATSLPPDWQIVASAINQPPVFVASADDGILRPATPDEMIDYLYGGEYDERNDSINDDGDDLAISEFIER